MTIYEYLTSDENIFHAIYSLKNSIQERNLLDASDKDEFVELYDVFNTVKILDKIKEVKNRLEKIYKKENFKAKVYFIPKSWDDVEKRIKYRPMHTVNLTDQICMIAMLNCLIREFDGELQSEWKIGGIAKMIPSNFYGNVLSDKTESVYRKWQTQYSEYTKKTHDLEKQYKQTREYKYEICLDIKDFFPSIDPRYIICYYMNHLSVDMDSRDKETVLILLKKLLYIELDKGNMNNTFLQIYYGSNRVRNKDAKFVKGIAQGLVQGYFFANLFMSEVSKVYKKVFPGKQLFYVDDSVIFSDVDVHGKKFGQKIGEAEKEINEFVAKEIERGNAYDVDAEIEYRIKIHNPDEEEECKSIYIDLQKTADGQIFLGNLSRMASGVAIELNNDFNENEMEILENRLKILSDEIKKELDAVDIYIEKLKVNGQDAECLGFLNYKKQLIRYLKYFSYRFYIINYRKNFSVKEICDYIQSSMNDIREKKEEDRQGDFLEFYTQTILNAVISFYIKNQDNNDENVDLEESALVETKGLEIEKILKKLNDYLYLDMAGEYSEKLSYVYKSFQDYLDLDGIEAEESSKRMERVKNFSDFETKKYASLAKYVSEKLPDMTKIAENQQRKFAKKYIQEVLRKQEKVYEVLPQTERMKKVYSVVESGSNEIKRMLLNACISYLCNIRISDDLNFIKTNNRPLNYCEIRILSYLRNYLFDAQILNKKIDDIFSDDENIDYSILEVMPYFKKFVGDQEFIDQLICVHKYTCDLWKNGSKYLYFYTMHNQEHAIDLIKSSVELVRAVNYIKIKKIDYFILFVACYLHDIAMVNIPDLKWFQENLKETNLIASRFLNEFDINSINDSQYVKEMLVKYYRAMDAFFEDLVRKQHAKQSAKEIRISKELAFLEICLREVVAEVSEAHGQGWADVYRKKSVAQEMTYSLKYMQIILRLADALDMKKYRVSKALLNKNIENMSTTSAFHWISHVIINDRKIDVLYEINAEEQESGDVLDNRHIKFSSRLVPGRIIEKIQLEVHFGSMSKTKDHKKLPCKGVNMNIVKNQIIISVINSKDRSRQLECNEMLCEKEFCNTACKWFSVKNNYLLEELVELQRYLNDVEDNFFTNEFSIKLVNDGNASLTQKQMDIVREYLDEY